MKIISQHFKWTQNYNVREKTDANVHHVTTQCSEAKAIFVDLEFVDVMVSQLGVLVELVKLVEHLFSIVQPRGDLFLRRLELDVQLFQVLYVLLHRCVKYRCVHLNGLVWFIVVQRHFQNKQAILCHRSKKHIT